jgi:hypothetical protein
MYREDPMKRLGLAVLVAASLPFAAVAKAQGDTVSVDSLRNMTQAQLDETYVNAEPGPMPDGDSQGTAVFFPGSILNTPTQLLTALVWQGKVFDAQDGVLVNKVFGFRLVKAKVYMGESLFDGKPSIIIDYSQTSTLAHMVRDEIREVAPGIYLGRAYIRSLLGDYMAVNFILNFN